MFAVIVFATLLALDLRNSNQVQVVRASKVLCDTSQCPEIAVTRKNDKEYYAIFFNNYPAKILKVIFQIDGRLISIENTKSDTDNSTFLESRVNGLSDEIISGKDVKFTLFLDDSTEQEFTVKTSKNSSDFFDELKNNYKRI